MGENNRETRPALDVKWFARFAEVGVFAPWEYLGGDKEQRREEKRKFLAGECKNPSLDYPKAIAEDWSKREQVLLELKKDILTQEPNEVVAQAYRWRLNEKIAQARMMMAIIRGDSRKIKRYGEFIYGRPSKDIFAFTINRIREQVKSCLNSENLVIRQAATDLDVALPGSFSEPTIIDLPEEEVIQRAKTVTEAEFADLINITEPGKVFDAEGAKTVVEKALLLVKARGWSVIIEEIGRKTGFAVSQEHQWVRIPNQTLRELTYVIVHEIGTHLKRGINGRRSRLMLLGVGLDRYGRGEEGIATMREQTLEGKVKDFAGLKSHLAISLAIGLDGKPRDFRDVYEILNKYLFFEKLVGGMKPEIAKEEAQDEAYNNCVWAFRGTDHKTPGICFTGDIEYREGNIGIWNVIRDNPKEMLRFSIGKYDPANYRHIWILEQLGITDKDLQDLENN